MPSFDRIVITGATGAVGSSVLRSLLDHFPSSQILCLLHTERSRERLGELFEASQLQRIESHIVDLTAQEQLSAWAAATGKADRCLIIHCAADVSWTKSERLMAPINVDATRRLAESARHLSRQRPVFVFVSTAFCGSGPPFRNMYEKTKFEAENLLADEFGAHLDLAIIRCSLVVGATNGGEISRFNGMYPLIRVVALAETPCLVADTECRLDTVPVDHVVSEILECARRLGDSCRLIRSVAAAGLRHAILLTELLELIQVQTNAFRAEAGLEPLAPVSIITERQFRFLMKAAKSWDMVTRFSQIERIHNAMAGYITHSNQQPLAIIPQWIGPAPAAPTSYLDASIRFWLERNRQRILANRKHIWQTGEGVAGHAV